MLLNARYAALFGLSYATDGDAVWRFFVPPKSLVLRDPNYATTYAAYS